MQVSERKRRENPALRAMAAKPPDISEYLRSQGFGPRELATLEAADSAAIRWWKKSSSPLRRKAAC